MQRSDLEIPKTPLEMEELIGLVANDRVSYSDQDVHLRRGFIKPLLEEYLPLSIFSRHFPDIREARLTPSSNMGPDAEAISGSGEKHVIQITVADESYETALGREKLSEGEPMFPGAQKSRNKKTGAIEESGSILTTREAELKKQVNQVVDAIVRKSNNYHVGTGILLIRTSIHLSDPDDYSWRNDLSDQVSGLNIPYEYVYLTNCVSGKDKLIPLKE